MSNTVTVTTEIGIDVAHRVFGHEGKCGSIHGHRYTFEIHAREKNGLDKLGRVIDFSILKERCEEWLLTRWDHGLVLWENDPLTKWFSKSLVELGCEFNGIQASATIRSPFADQKFFATSLNPTAENLGIIFLSICRDFLFADNSDIEIVEVRVWETPKHSAIVSHLYA